MSRRLAYLIGNHKFRADSGLAPLPGVPNDLSSLARVFGDPAWGKFETRVFPNEESSKIKEAVEEQLGEVGPNDLMLIYYSGHGKLDRLGNLCLATADTRAAALYATSIPARHLRDLVNNSDCGTVVFFLDCCYSGAATTDLRGDIESQLSSLQDASGFYILAASSAIQTAGEAEAEHNGLLMGRFTSAIVDGIENGLADSDGDGRISLYDLFRYVSVNIKHQTPKYYAARSSGDPVIAFCPVSKLPPDDGVNPLNSHPNRTPGAAAPNLDVRAADRERLINMLTGSDPVAGEAALPILGSLGPDILPAVIEQSSGRPQQRLRLRKLCGQLGSAAIPVLVDCISKGRWDTKLAAAPCFGAYRGNSLAKEYLWKLLKAGDQDFDVLRLAVEAAGHLAFDDVRWNIVRLAKGGDFERDQSSFEIPDEYAFGKLSTYVLEALFRFFGQTGESSVLRQIEEVIERMVEYGLGGQVRGCFRASENDLTPVAADAVVAGWLNHANEKYREYAIDTLGYLKLRRTLPALVDVLRNSRESPEVRDSAAIAIGEFGDMHAARALVAILADKPDLPNLEWGFSTLYAQPIDWPSCSSQIDSALRRSHPETRQQMLLSLAWRGEVKYQDDIERGIAASDPFERGTSALALAHMNGGDAKGLLLHSADEATSELERAFAIAAQVHAGQEGRGNELHDALQNLPFLPKLRPCWKRELLLALVRADRGYSRASLWAEIGGVSLDKMMSETEAMRANAEDRTKSSI